MLQVKLETPTNQNSLHIELTKGMFAIVDRYVIDELFDYVWVAVKWNFRWYAYSWKKVDGSRSRISMHRLIAQTALGEIPHHLNKNTLDNRRANLLNMTPRAHRQLHGIRRYGRKKQDKTTIAKRPGSPYMARQEPEINKP